MKIGYCQFDVKFGKIKENLDKIDNLVGTTDADLIVLPEFFSTGIVFSGFNEAKKYAEKIPDGYTVQHLIKIAKKKEAYITGSILEFFEGDLYNTAVLVGAEGLVGTHRKVHLTDYEKDIFQPGDGFQVFDIKNVKIGILTCFECWFPEASRILASQGVQIICHNVNTSSKLTYEMCKARAIESKAYFITCNRIGKEENNNISLEFIGESRIFDYNGDVLIKAQNNDVFQVIDINPQDAINKNYDDCNCLFTEVRKYVQLYKSI